MSAYICQILTCKWLRLDTWVPQHMLASTPSMSMIRMGPAWSSGRPRLLTWCTHTSNATSTHKQLLFFVKINVMTKINRKQEGKSKALTWLVVIVECEDCFSTINHNAHILCAPFLIQDHLLTAAERWQKHGLWSFHLQLLPGLGAEQASWKECLVRWCFSDAPVP